MKFIIGGAYQGKLDYAVESLNISSEDVFDCADCGGDIDFSKRCIYHMECFALWCVKNGVEAKDYLIAHKDEFKDSTIICEDVFCGIVPIDDDLRAWREMCGRLCTYLSREADEVVRLFCGLPQKIK